MSLPAVLLPASVLLPLALATLLVALAHCLPPLLSNVLAILTAVLVALICVFLAREAMHGPVLHWFGSWSPAASTTPGVVLGISFLADPASAAVAAFSASLFAATFIFAWSYFDEVHSHFQILMLLFLAGITGFCLTHDLFNLFVWFELMSVAAFALTAYPLGKSSLEGAFNFTITNAVGSYMMLAGIALLYARTGTLDFTQTAAVVSRIGNDPVIGAGFCLIAAALLTKGAVLPFHMWLADAHAVAPSPVSVIFSGIMVSVALFALAKIIGQIFIHDAAVMALARLLLLWLGAATALIGGLMAFAQRHLKRLLAFSTIAHLGVMLTAIAAVTPVGYGAFLLYLFGHGLIKGTLFMIAGVLLALRNSGDEIKLYGNAAGIWPAGAAMALGGFMLGGLPFGLLHDATDTLLSSWSLAAVIIVISTALTGAAVLRAGCRIFLGVSGAPGPEITGPTEREQEKDERPLWLMLLPCAVMLAVALIPGTLISSFLGLAGARLIDPFSGEAAMPSAELSVRSFAPIAICILIVCFSVIRARATRPLARALFHLELAPFRALQFLHSGVVGDYVAWMMIGVAAFAAFLGR